MARPHYSPNQSIGPWQLVRCLGVGGNGEVWLARSGVHGTAAVKFLRRGERQDSEPYRRFRDETAILHSLTGSGLGILPLIAFSLPDRSTSEDPAWLATPVATRLEEALAGAPLAEIVRAMREVANTLAALAARGVAHRDIKPANLFVLDNRTVIGDFGLATYPGKAAVTGTARELGPLYFLAPEMLNHPLGADGHAADVYSLAKTCWVLATGQTFPLPGEHRPDTDLHLLSRWVDGPRVYLLDRLIERMTVTAPAARPRAAEVERELDAWLALSDPPMSGDEGSLEQQGARVRALIAPHRARQATQAQFQHLVSQLRSFAQARVGELAGELYQQTGMMSPGRSSGDDLVKSSAVEAAADYCGAALASTNLVVESAEIRHDRARLVLGVGLVSDPDRSQVVIHAVLLISAGAGFPAELYRETATADPGGPQAIRLVMGFTNDLRNALSRAVGQLADAIERRRS